MAGMEFSHRVPDQLTPNRLAAARQRLGIVPWDLTVSNPTRCGLPYPRELLRPLADPRGLVYRPEPRGPLAARRAVAAELARWGATVPAEQLVLTASTSEAYGMLFTLLCDPGDVVLVPTPSYPLFEQLARLAGVATASFRLDPESCWAPALGDLEAAPGRTRAVILVQPNNPTGSLVATADLAAVAALCRRRDWALIVDEVFLPYPLDSAAPPSTAGADDGLCCTLGGLSKRAGLPQVKLGWIAVTGRPEQVEAALARLDWIADAALSVSTPVAAAAAELLAASEALRAAIHQRCRRNLATLRRLVAAVPALTVPRVDGGWSAPLRVPALLPDEELALRLLAEDGVAVHPGYLFDLPGDGWLVLSLLPPEHDFAAGVERVVARLGRLVAGAGG